MKYSTFCFILLILFSFSAFAQFNFLPDTVDNHQILTYTQFTLSYNEEHEQAEWVAYEYTREEALTVIPRCRNCFTSDINVTTGSATEADYINTGFDKGHLCPARDNNMSDDANRESFLMSNMSPQLHKFNNGIWKEYEKWVREKAEEFDTVYVVTGPVFINNLGRIGANGVTIPGYFYKSLLRFEDGKPKTIAFLVPHVGAVGELKDYVVSINALETLTNLNFYPALHDSTENKVESRHSSSQWGL